MEKGQQTMCLPLPRPQSLKDASGLNATHEGLTYLSQGPMV